MLQFPNCKINLGLYITGRREDGYHNVETIFYPVALNDVLEIVPAATTQLHFSGLPIAGAQEDNLVWKAWNILKQSFPGKVKELDIYLHKHIPMGAGLGGGSADAAFMLQMMNEYFELGLDEKQLAVYALQLGSDCPFFIYNTPQFAKGRGEIMSSINIDLSAYSIQLICPGIHVPTIKAFQLIQAKAANFDLARLPEIPIEAWKNNIGNDFETPVFELFPVLAEIKKQLYAAGAIYASMSGSGSTIYGIFKKGHKAELRVEVEFQEYYE